MGKSTNEWLPAIIDFELFHIYCHQKDYRLCDAINRSLRFELIRIRDLFEIQEMKDETEKEKEKRNNAITYAQFYFRDDISHRETYILTNRPAVKRVVAMTGDLFPTEKSDLLIPELPHVDYFVQLYGQYERYELSEIEEQLNRIPMINAVRHADTDGLNSYINLMH